MNDFESECDRLSWTVNPAEAKKRKWQKTVGVVLDSIATRLIDIFNERDDFRLTRAGRAIKDGLAMTLSSKDPSEIEIVDINLRMSGEEAFLWLSAKPGSRFLVQANRHPKFASDADADELKSVLAGVLGDIEDSGEN